MAALWPRSLGRKKQFLPKKRPFPAVSAGGASKWAWFMILPYEKRCPDRVVSTAGRLASIASDIVPAFLMSCITLLSHSSAFFKLPSVTFYDDGDEALPLEFSLGRIQSERVYSNVLRFIVTFGIGVTESWNIAPPHTSS
ncbi:hypothetical protein AAG570_009126 [Ranatra chinensis]|uniref:Uncharacterized protein n=1 Tax=Ranatra chinensis TaxID=642074 RepID=A0ABD0YSX9_9HEMI